MLGLNDQERFSFEAFEVRRYFHQLLAWSMSRILGHTKSKEVYNRENLWKMRRNLSNDLNPLSFEVMQSNIVHYLKVKPEEIAERILQNDSVLRSYYRKHKNFPFDFPEKYKLGSYLKSENFQKYVKQMEEVNNVPIEMRSNFVDPQRKIYSRYTRLILVTYILRKILYGELLGERFISPSWGQINPYEVMYIYSDIVKPEPFNDMMSRLLASIKSDGVPGHMTSFESKSIQYKNLDQSDISNIKVLIASGNGEPIPFQRGPSELTLHFVRESLLRNSYFT